MKRLFAMLAAAGLAGAIVASAANLNVDGGTVQAGLATDLTCDDTGVFVEAYGYEQNDNSVRSVTIGGIEGSCFGNDLIVTAFDGTTVIGDSVPVTIDESSERVSFKNPVNATAIDQLQVAITS